MTAVLLRLALLGLLVLGACAGPAARSGTGPAPRQIAVTIDDLPFAGLPVSAPEAHAGTDRMLRALRRQRVPAIGFVNEDQLAGAREAGLALLRAWLDAGMDLGNHNYGHVGLQETPLEAYQAAVLRGEAETRRLLTERGRPLLYYRHPFTQVGPTMEIRRQFETFLAGHNYVVAPFTIEHDDYVFSLVYDDALARGDAAEAERIRRSYLAHLEPALDAFESMSEELFGRAIPQIWLIHANQLNADTMAQMLDRLRARNYRFISLQQALRDPAYASPDRHVGPTGPSWLLRWARARGQRMSVGGQPDPEPWIMQRYRELSARQQ